MPLRNRKEQMGNKPIEGVADPVNDQDAVNKRTLDAAVAAATASAASLYAPKESPVLTGDPRAPTPTAGDNDTSIATTAFVQGEIAGKAPLASPAFTGSPTAPTQAAGDNSTKLATTAYADSASPWKAVKKTTAQSIASSTTLTDDTQLLVSLAANTDYLIRGVLYIDSGGGGFRWSMTGPSGATTIRYNPVASNGGQSAYGSVASFGAGASTWKVDFTAMIRNGSTAGTLSIQFCQNASDASNTTMIVGSWLEYRVF